MKNKPLEILVDQNFNSLIRAVYEDEEFPVQELPGDELLMSAFKLMLGRLDEEVGLKVSIEVEARDHS